MFIRQNERINGHMLLVALVEAYILVFPSEKELFWKPFVSFCYFFIHMRYFFLFEV